jgi:prepilin-type N-terminal cleavage/methylation domain-containing protein
MRQSYAGFSLIELMIVVSIIGILTMMGVPSYHHYTERSRFVEVIASTEPYKTAVAIALQSAIPQNELVNGTHGIPSELKKTKNVASIKVENGIITATASELATGSTYILKPNSDGSNWTVSGTCLRSGLCSA